MRRAAAALALALCLVGCDWMAIGERVELLTGDPLAGGSGEGACYTNWTTGLLVVDAKYGTAIVIESFPGDPEGGATIPVMWRPGYTGRRSGSEVVVLDPAGSVVATTGNKYKLEGGGWYKDPQPFFACGFVIQQ